MGVSSRIFSWSSSPWTRAKAVGDGLQPARLGDDVNVGGDVRTMHDLGQPLQGRVGEAVLDHDRLEAAAAGPRGPARRPSRRRDGLLALGDGGHLLVGTLEELSFLVDEAADQPGAGDAIHVGVLPGYPLHGTDLLPDRHQPAPASRHCGEMERNIRADELSRGSHAADVSRSQVAGSDLAPAPAGRARPGSCSGARCAGWARRC